MTSTSVLRSQSARAFGLCLSFGVLAGCEELPPQLAFLQPADAEASASADADTTGRSVKLIERDVESPEVFQVSEAGLWDGRPSLGGIWVAHPDVTEPERVIIRNNANGKFVIGALFRREREIPGPRVQASSDAAAALGMLAGAPVRRETVEEVQPEPEAPAEETVRTAALDGDAIRESALDPIAAAAAAIEAAADTPSDTVPEAAPIEAKPLATTLPETTLPKTLPATPSAAIAAAAAPKPAHTTFSLDKPYIQIGIFGVQANANRTADQMRRSGMVPTVFEEKTSGKTFWRVVVGPARTKSERTALLSQIKNTGFSDAYAVAK